MQMVMSRRRVGRDGHGLDRLEAELIRSLGGLRLLGGVSAALPDNRMAPEGEERRGVLRDDRERSEGPCGRDVHVAEAPAQPLRPRMDHVRI